jgi:hypothetical protein
MAENQTLTEIAAEARALGWERRTDLDHVRYVSLASYQMLVIATALAAADGPRWLTHAYQRESQSYPPPGIGWWKLVIPPTLLPVVARATPSRWAAEVAVLAEGRRRTGRAMKLLGSCRRIQLAMVRHGMTPLGRATAPIDGDDRTRPSFLLPRETEIEREDGWTRFWGGDEGGGSPGAAASRGRAAREALTAEDLEGWEG